VADYGITVTVRSTVITVITELRSLKKIVIVQYDDCQYNDVYYYEVLQLKMKMKMIEVGSKS
jgi:hypothetical protein